MLWKPPKRTDNPQHAIQEMRGTFLWCDCGWKVELKDMEMFSQAIINDKLLDAHALHRVNLKQ